MKKKNYKKLIAATSILLSLAISVSVSSISGNAYDYQETDMSLVGRSKEENSQLETETNINEKELVMYGASALPSRVDNSTSKYFPPIASQGGIGSCASWATAYYTLSYMYNKSRDRTATYDNSFSPRFLFNLSNNNMAQGGTPFRYLADFLKKVGCVTNAEFPYNGDYSIWPTTEKAYKSAAKHKVEKFEILENVGIDGKLITSTDDEDILEIKTALSDGYVMPFQTYFDSFNYSELKSNNSGYNNGFVGEKVVISCDGKEGDHEMTLVGYDDNIWSDINNNNKIDDGEMGAFKIANSHGDGYCNKGFVWVAYDALNKKSMVDKVISEKTRIQIFTDVGKLDVMPETYVPHKFVKITASTKDRYHTNVKIKGTWEDKTFELNKIIQWTNWGFDTVSYDGTNNETEGTFAFDLGYIMDPIGCTDINEVDWEIEVYSQGENPNPITLKDCVIYDDQTGVTIRKYNTFPITVCNDSKAINFHNGVAGNNAIVYYRGYKNPVISYKINNSYTEINKSMKYDTDEYGYVNRIVIPLGTASQATVRFGNGSGAWDNNNGNGYIAVKGKNYFVTENVGDPVDFELSNLLNGTSDVGVKDSYTVKYISGYEPLKYKYVIKEKGTNRTEAESEYKLLTKNSNLLAEYFYEKEGIYEISVFAMDSSGAVCKKSIDIEIKDEPLTFTDFYIEGGKDNISLLSPIKLIAKTKNNNMETNNCGYKLDIIYSDKVIFSKTVSSLVRENTIAWREPDLKTCQYHIEWTPPSSGGYYAIISRRDANGEYSYKTLRFSVLEDTGTMLKEFKVSPENSAKKGERIKVSAKAENLDDPKLTFEYSYSYIKYGKETIVQDYTSSESCEFALPDEYGPYEILVKAKSGDGEIVMDSKTVWVEQIRGIW